MTTVNRLEADVLPLIAFLISSDVEVIKPEEFVANLTTTLKPDTDTSRG
jgi:hypothetical protein